METDNRLMISNLQKLDHFYSLMSRATNLPYTECDAETFDDQIFIFTEEADANAMAEKLNADRYPVTVANFDRVKMQALYTGLYLTGVNRVAFHNGSGLCYLPLASIVTIKKPEQKPGMAPVMNDSLQMTAVYFLQELRRPDVENSPERTSKLRELEQELIANLLRSRFIVALDTTDVKGTPDLSKPNPDLKLPFLKNQSGDTMQPIFSDLWEFEKFRVKNPRKLQPLALPFQKLIPSLIQDIRGYVLNPMGFNLMLPKDRVETLIKQS